MKKLTFNWRIISFILLFLAFLGALTAAFLFWQKIQNFEPNVYHYVPPEISFIYSQENLNNFGIEKYIQEKITTERARLIKENKSFIDLDLKEMKLALYEEGELLETFLVQSKGKEGSWWETASGVYFVGDKVINHFSSIARAWMPYGVQFYGNFFIHGWPYYSNGRIFPSGPSGGCVRLKTADAAVVFKFAERGMPVLVFDEKTIDPLSALKMLEPEIIPPNITGENLLIADLKTGEIIASKEMDSEIFAGPMVKGILSLTASEVVNLEKRIIAKPWMFEDIAREGIIVPEKSYRAYDLFYPLIGQSSKEAAMVLSRFFTQEYFLLLMNVKARAIGMDNTGFADIIGVSEKNTTTLYGAAKMMRYINDYRGFIFEVSISDKNMLPEIQKENLIGIFSGKGKDKKETIFSAWKMKTPQDNISRIIFIGIADSENVQKDLKSILLWLNRGFGLK